MTIDEIEQWIYNYYRSMTARITELKGPVVAGYTKVQEVGEIASYWAIADALYLEDAKKLTYKECVNEYGTMTAMEREF